MNAKSDPSEEEINRLNRQNIRKNNFNTSNFHQFLRECKHCSHIMPYHHIHMPHMYHSTGSWFWHYSRWSGYRMGLALIFWALFVTFPGAKRRVRAHWQGKGLSWTVSKCETFCKTLGGNPFVWYIIYYTDYTL
jgi:hypothetical protein